ncbi:MAG: hypothetical protein RLZZ419_2095 [Pseudomonadota bacterium]
MLLLTSQEESNEKNIFLIQLTVAVVMYPAISCADEDDDDNVGRGREYGYEQQSQCREGYYWQPQGNYYPPPHANHHPQQQPVPHGFGLVPGTYLGRGVWTR